MALRSAFCVLLLLGVSLVHVNAQANFALDCNPAGAIYGRVVIPPTTALDNQMTIHADVNMRSNWATAWVFYASGSPDIGLQLRRNGGNAAMRFQVGNTVVDSSAFALSPERYYSLAVRVDTTATYKVEFIVNGVVISRSTSALTVASGSRTMNICHGKTFAGLIDNFAIWRSARTADQISAWPKTIPMNSQLQEELEFWFPFDEGFGDSAVAITPVGAAVGQNWIRGTFDDAQYAYTTIRSYARCQSWGDPHIHVWNWNANMGLESPRPKVPEQVEWTANNDPEKGTNPESPWAGHRLNGVHRMTSCGDSFEVRVLSNKQPSWSAHVNRAVGIRAYDRFFLITHANEVSGLPLGAYQREVNGGWVAIPSGTTDQDVNGVYYSWKNSNSFKLVMPQVGYFELTVGWAYLNFDIYLDKEKCPASQRARGACDWTHKSCKEGLRVDFMEWKYGADPVEPALPTPEPACDGSVKAAAELACLNYAPSTPQDQWTPGERSRYDACVMDICASGDPELTADLPPEQSCALTDFANLQAGTYTTSACGKRCPNGCSAHGSCSNGVCTCNAGWVGPDCGQPAAFDCYDLSVASDAQSEIRKVESFSLFNGQNPRDVAERFAVEDSIVIFPAASRSSPDSAAALARNLVIALDSKRSPDGGSVRIEIDFDVSISGAVVEGAVKQTANKIVIDRTGANAWRINNQQQFAVIANLPTVYVATINVFSPVGISQVLVGSATRRQELDVLKVASGDWSGNRLVLTANDCSADPCASSVAADPLNACSTCNLDTRCGYCVESGRCMLGDAAGPRRGQCRNWRYQPGSTTVSRRVTMEFGWPVTPAYSEVILTDSGDTSVPVDVRVNAGNLGNVWDVMLMLEASVDDDLITMVNSIQSKLLPTLQDTTQFPELAFGLARYGNSVSLLKDLGNVNPNTVWQYQRALESFRGSDVETRDALASLGKIVPQNGFAAPHWRQNARRLAIIQTSFVPQAASMTPAALQTLRSLLVQHRIVPVFAVSHKNVANLRATFDAFVTNFEDFGFGLVLDLAADSADIHAVVQKAIRLAQGQIALVRKTLGFVDNDNLNALAGSLNINGLTNSHRARFHIPVTYDSAVTRYGPAAELSAVGFGSTKIQDIASERPTCASQPRVVTDEDVPIDIFLVGDSYRSLVKPVRFIVTPPTDGSLFQVNTDDSTGAQITNAAGEFVLHPSGKVRFLGNQDAHGTNDGNNVYATFTYRTYDGCVESADSCQVTVFVMPVNDVPEIQDFFDTTPEDAPKTITIEVVDPDFIPQSDLIFIGLVTLPANGKVSFEGVDVTPGSKFPPAGTSGRTVQAVYTPNVNWNGNDVFTYQAYDQTNAASRVHTFHMTVTPVNDNPTGSIALPVIASEDTVSAISLGGDDVDFDDTVQFVITIPADFNGQLFAVNCSSNCGSETALTTGIKVPTAGRLEVPAHHTVFYLAPPNQFSCDAGQVPVQGTPGSGECGPLTTFYFEVEDQDGARSAQLTVPIHVTNVNDLPTAQPKAVTFAEDTCGTVTLSGSDIDLANGASALTFEIVTFPANIEIKHNGVAVTKASPKVGSSGLIEICSRANEFGDPNPGLWQWWYSTFTYQSFDGALYSDSATVDVYVTPVNDAPIAVDGAVSTNEDTQVIISLVATDVDNSNAELTFYIKSLPDAAKGTLYFYDDAAANKRGALATAGRAAANSVVPFGSDRLVVFVPSSNWFGDATFTFEVQDDDKHGSNDLWSNTATVTITVVPVNDAPTAGMDNVVMDEDTTAVITLLGSDDYFGEHSTLQAIITQPIFGSFDGCQNLGFLYQYDPAKAVGDYSEADRITAPNTAVTDAQNRVIYIPPASNFNSDASVPYRNIRPAFLYKMVEVDSQHLPRPLETNEVLITITINPVNDAPRVITDADVADGTDVCWNENCRVQEDLGTHYRENAGTVGLWFGGDDVERSTLDILITGVDCPAGALLQTIEDVPQDVPRTGVSDASPFVLPTRIDLYQPLRCTETLPAPPLVQGLVFAPALDANGDGYCTITYRVRDAEQAVSGIKQIVISVTPVNDIPRATEYIKKLDVFESEALSFPVVSYDVEGDAFKLRILSCDASHGKFSVSTGRGSTVVDCNAAPYIFPFVPAPGADGRTTWQFTFTPNFGENQPVPYNELRFEFPEDTTGDVPTTNDLYIVEVVVLPRNAPPVIVLPNDLRDFAEYTFTAKSAPLPLSITDDDVDALTTAFEFTATIERVGDGPTQLLLNGEAITLPWTATLPLPDLNAMLATAEVQFSQTRQDETATFQISANDNGAIGNCRDTSGNLSPCALTGTAQIVLKFRTNAGIVGTAVGAGSAIGAGAAAVLAALAYRRFRKREDKMEPWTFEDQDHGFGENPIYDDNGVNQDNPLYEFTKQQN